MAKQAADPLRRGLPDLTVSPAALPSVSVPPPVRLETGAIEVGDDVQGFVVYGGYFTLPDGLYLIDTRFEAAGDIPAVLDVFDHGVVLAETNCAPHTRLLVNLTDVTALEVRIRALGGAFRCDSIRLRCLYDTRRRAVAAELDSIAADLAADGRADLAATIIDFLTEAGSPEEAVGFTEAGSVAGMLPGRRMELIWRALHTGQPVDQWSMMLDQDASTRGGAAQAFLKAAPPPEVIDYSSSSAEAAAALRAHGLDAAALRVLAADRWSLEEELVGRSLGPAALSKLRHARSGLVDHPAFRSSLMRKLAESEHAFQTTALVLGCVVAPSPLTGQPLVSRHSIVTPIEHGKQVFLFYYFAGPEPFYLGVGGWAGQKALVYFPLKNLVVGLMHPSQSWTPFPALIDALKHFVLVEADEVGAYLASETRPALLTSTVNNMGHSFWNDQSRLMQLDRAGLLGSVDAMVVYREVFIEPTEVVDFAGEVLRPSTPSELTATVYRNRLFCVRPTALALRIEDVERIQAAARAATTEATWAQIEVAQQSGFLLWANLRAHNKVWVGQVEGILQIAQDLVADHGSLALFLDGMRDCGPLMREISERAPPGVTVFEGTNLPLADSISWAFAIDSYVATIGSGLTLVTWLANKPGLAHSEKGHLSQLEFWREVREGLAPIHAPKLSEIEETVGGWYSDYHIPLDKMRRLMRKAAKHAKPTGRL